MYLKVKKAERITAAIQDCCNSAFFESSVIILIFSYYLLSLVLNRHNDDKAEKRYATVNSHSAKEKYKF